MIETFGSEVITFDWVDTVILCKTSIVLHKKGGLLRFKNLFAIEDLPQTVKNSGMVLLSDWNKYFDYPSEASLRQMIFHDKHGIRSAICKFCGRQYISLEKIRELVEKETSEYIENCI